VGRAAGCSWRSPHQRRCSPTHCSPQTSSTQQTTVRTSADVFAYAACEGIQLRLDGTKTQVRRPRANRSGRRALVWGKRKQHPHDHDRLRRAGSDAVGRGGTPRADARPDRGQDRRHRGPAAPASHRQRRLSGAGHGVRRPNPRGGHPSRVRARLPGEAAAWQRARTRQSSRRIGVSHAGAEHQQWRALQHSTGRRDSDAQTHLAIAGLVLDRAACR